MWGGSQKKSEEGEAGAIAHAHPKNLKTQKTLQVLLASCEKECGPKGGSSFKESTKREETRGQWEPKEVTFGAVITQTGQDVQCKDFLSRCQEVTESGSRPDRRGANSDFLSQEERPQEKKGKVGASTASKKNVPAVIKGRQKP